MARTRPGCEREADVQCNPSKLYSYRCEAMLAGPQHGGCGPVFEALERQALTAVCEPSNTAVMFALSPLLAMSITVVWFTNWSIKV